MRSTSSTSNTSNTIATPRTAGNGGGPTPTTGTSMKPLHNLAFALSVLAAAASGPAHALMVSSVSTRGASVVTDYSTSGLMSFDLDLNDAAPVAISFRVEAADLGAPLAFNAVLRNFIGQGLGGLQLRLAGSGFDRLGSVVHGFGGTALLSQAAPGAVDIDLLPLEFLDLQLGNPLGTTGPGAPQDWTISTTGLGVGSLLTLNVTAAVPEPASWSLAAAALGLCVLSRRRRGAPGLADSGDASAAARPGL